jgi:hypothetical protein
MKTTFSKLTKLKALIIVGAAILCVQAQAQSNTKDTTKPRKQLFELSFGSTMMFISNSDIEKIKDAAKLTIPTSTMLFFAEFRPQSKWRIPVFLNIPTESKQFIVTDSNGKQSLVNEKASITLGTGFQYKPFEWTLYGDTKLEFEAGPLISSGMDNNKKLFFAPVLAGRLMVKKGSDFIMYFGGSYAFGVNSIGILYGTGTVF